MKGGEENMSREKCFTGSPWKCGPEEVGACFFLKEKGLLPTGVESNDLDVVKLASVVRGLDIKDLNLAACKVDVNTLGHSLLFLGEQCPEMQLDGLNGDQVSALAEKVQYYDSLIMEGLGEDGQY